MALNNELVVRTLNYHGQQLTGFLQNEQPTQELGLDLKGVNYQVYQGRSKELRMEDRGKRLLLHRFVAHNLQGLFSHQHTRESPAVTPVAPPEPDLTAVLPPIETFLEADKEARTRHFFELVCQHDVVYCKVGAKNMTGLLLGVQGFHPLSGKSRHLEDLRLKCFCPAAEMVAAAQPNSPNRTYDQGDTICAVVLEVKREAQRLLVSMKDENVPEGIKDKVKLGLISISELPPVVQLTKQAVEKKLAYDVFLEKSIGFLNPSNIHQLTDELGLSSKVSSLLPSLKDEFPTSQCAPALRKRQNAKWAFNHVASGINYFKAGNNIEAFQCLNQALKIDPENVEGLVARGALYANNGSLEKAVADFEVALKINPEHKNAKKYLCETLVAVARGHEDEGKLDLAAQIYHKVTSLSPGSKEAQAGMQVLQTKSMVAASGFQQFAGGGEKPPLELREKLNILLGEDEPKPKKTVDKKKKRRSRRRSSSSSSSSSGSSSSSSSSSDDSSKRKRSKKKKDKAKSKSRGKQSRSDSSVEEQRAMSPFSQKMMPGGMSFGVPPFGANPALLQGMNLAAGFPQIPAALLQQAANPGKKMQETDLEKRDGTKRSPTNPNGAAAAQFDIPPPGMMPSYAQNPYAMYGHQGYPGQGPMYPAAPQQQKSRQEEEYDRAVQAFLRQTSGGGGSSRSAAAAPSDGKRRSGSQSRKRGEESRSREEDRRRSREKSKGKSKEEEKRKSSSVAKEEKGSSSRRRKASSKSSSEDEKTEKKKRKESSSNKGGSERLKERSVKELVKLGFAEDMDVDEFAEKLSSYLKGKDTKPGKSASKAETGRNGGKTAEKDQKGDKDVKRRKFEEDKEEKEELGGDKKIYTDGMNVVVKELKPPREEASRRRKEASPLRRQASPGVKAVFDVFDDNSPASSKTSKGNADQAKPLWKPIGSDSLAGTMGKALDAVARMADRTALHQIKDRISERRENSRRESESNMTRNMEFVVQLDPITGMYVRKPKFPSSEQQVPPQRHDYGERRIVRTYSGSPPRSPGRARSPSHDRDYRRRSRSRSRERRSDSRERGQRQNPRSFHGGSRRSRSRERYRDRSPDYGRGYERDSDIQGMMSESLELQKEREQVEREKAELLAQQREMEESLNHRSMPQPVPLTTRGQEASPRGGGPGDSRSGRRQRSRSRERRRSQSPVAGKARIMMPDKRQTEGRWAEEDNNVYMDNVMKSVLDVAGDGDKKSRRPDIIPGARSFDDIEAYLDAAKKQRKDEMMQRNKGFVKPKIW